MATESKERMIPVAFEYLQCKTVNDKIKYIEEEIDKYFLRVEPIFASPTYCEVQGGIYFIELKELIEGFTKLKWKQYLGKRFPYITPKMARRVMKISRGCELHQFPLLELLSQNRLYLLCNFAGEGISVGEYLINEFDIDARVSPPATN